MSSQVFYAWSLLQPWSDTHLPESLIPKYFFFLIKPTLRKMDILPVL